VLAKICDQHESVKIADIVAELPSFQPLHLRFIREKDREYLKGLYNFGDLKIPPNLPLPKGGA
jgi:hypothetical protein